MIPVSTILLESNDLAIGYRNGKQTHFVHRHLHFSLRRGELTCLLGENGAGKSTLLRTLAGTQKPLEGNLKLAGKELTAYSEAERSRTIGIVLTDRTQAGGLTVGELVALGRQPHTGFFGRLSAKDHRLIEEAMSAVGIAHKAHCYTAELSDGERQKVMIAKALVQECPLILLDEPTAFLDVVSRIEIMTLLHKLAVEENRAILLSTHDIEQALVLSDRLWLLTKENGLISGITEDLVLTQQMDRLFPGRKILFDLMHGGYSPVIEGQYMIRLKTEDETLRHWTQNALNRHQILCINEDEQMLSAQLPVLYVICHNDIRLQTAGQADRRFHSFEEMLQGLSGIFTRSV